MTTGSATYLRLKVHLIQNGRKLKDFAITLGTTPQQVQSTVETFAGSDRIPQHPMSLKILEAVASELRDATILPVAKVEAGAEERE